MPTVGAPRPKPSFTASGFFVLRTPLLPFDDFVRWSQDVGPSEAARSALRERLRAAISIAEVRDALFVASPDLEESLPVWVRDPDGQKGRRIESALVRYYARMAGRATPFGLFAGCSVGTVGTETSLKLEGRARYRRHTRLDTYYLSALAEAVGRDPRCRKDLVYRPNSSLYSSAGRLRYAESRSEQGQRTYRLVAAEGDDFLRATIERAQTGASAAALARALTQDDPEIFPEEAEQYVDELIDRQILVPDLAPQVTGGEPIVGLLEQLAKIPGSVDAARHLAEVNRIIEKLDEAGLGASPEGYRDVGRRLAGLPVEIDPKQLFQVDMTKPSPAATLGRDVLDEILRGVEILHRLTGPRRPDPFEKFREAFSERYGDREVPLVEALDEEAGIGFQASGGESSPLLAGIAFVSFEEGGTRFEPAHRFLLEKLEETRARHEQELVLEDGDLKALSVPGAPPLPGAFSVNATVAASSQEALARGEFRVVLGAVNGPSGARFLGRFCHADPSLLGLVKEHLLAEEAQRPDAIFAEVVHLPQGRLGNILCRPVLRGYEIPYLGVSGAPPERQLPITDLLVSLRAGRVTLRSARLGREIVPRLTTAHNYWWGAQGLYRFLCTLQSQGTIEGMGWSWGPFSGTRFLPRVVSERLVLSRARWLVDRSELRALKEAKGEARYERVRTWCEERKLPRFVTLSEGDNELPIDFHNVLSVDAFVALTKERSQVALVEVFPGPDELTAHGPEGSFVSELIVPFVSTAEPSRSPERVPSRTLRRDERSFPPGSEWLYAKLYCGTSTADRILREVVLPVADEALRCGAADRWFFIRYGDPDWHVRLRFHGDPGALGGVVLPALRSATSVVFGDGALWRMQLDTYEREVERYGGPEAIALAERIFHVDSEAVLELLESFPGDAGADARWRLAAAGIDRMFADMGLDLAARRELSKNMGERFGARLGMDKVVRIQLGAKYRTERKRLEALLEPRGAVEPMEFSGLEVLRRRSERLTPLFAELRSLEAGALVDPKLADVASSYAHMHVNRLLRSAHAPHEAVLYDFLGRYYESQVSRARSRSAVELGA